jgi:hypothetical protein
LYLAVSLLEANAVKTALHEALINLFARIFKFLSKHPCSWKRARSAVLRLHSGDIMSFEKDCILLEQHVE